MVDFQSNSRPRRARAREHAGNGRHRDLGATGHGLAFGLGDADGPDDVRMVPNGNGTFVYRRSTFHIDVAREQRAQMSATERRERTRDALAKLPDFLDSVWSFEPWTERERRYVLFKLWDECDDTLAGAQARATILAFIRRRVTGYTAAELEALNAERSSDQAFAPTPEP